MTSDVAKKEELAQARATASQIRQGIRNYLATLALIARAHRERHWKVLGYESWQEYIDGEYGADRLRLPEEHRQKAITELRLGGMSVRAIGEILDMPKSSVADEMAQLSAAGQLEQPATIVGTDGRERPASRPDRPAARGEADGQLDAADVRTVAEREAQTGSEDRVRAADSSVEGSGDDSTDGAEPRDSLGEGSDAAGAPAHFPDAGAPDPVSQVNRVLDALVPDDNPHREWQRRFLADIHAMHRLMRNDVEDVAEKADSQCIEELGRIFAQLDRYKAKVLAALKASTPDNVTPLRRSS